MVRKLFGAFLLVMVLCANTAEAKNLDGRFGFGFSRLGFTGANAVSLKYFHNFLLATRFDVGFSTATSAYQFGIQTTRQVILEENMNVFLGVGGSIISDLDSTGTAGTGVQFEAVVGGEFFLAGLPNLGFEFEAGICLQSLRGTHFRSIGGGFASGGIHYYF